MLKRLDQQCNSTLKTGYRPLTARNFRSKANIYYRFCKLFQLVPFLSTEQNLTRYSRYIANGVQSYDTVKVYLSAVSRTHGCGVSSGSSSPLVTNDVNKEGVGGTCQKGSAGDPTLVEVVDLSSLVETLCYVALLIGFYLFLCKSNQVPDMLHGFNGKEQLTRQDVWQHGKLTMFDIKWSKANQYRQRNLLLPLIPTRNKKRLSCVLGEACVFMIPIAPT